jgi:hypothetical protein
MKQFFIDNAQHISGKGFINVDLMKSQKGTYYFKLDTWKPKNTDTVAEIKQDIRETLNPNITAEEAKILAEHRAKYKVTQPEDEDMSMEEFAKSIPF